MRAGKALTPKVSVVAVSYNQEKYIRKTIESFLAQKANFSFEVIIADDCSTDGTAKIIQEYGLSHPEIIKPILRGENIGITQNFIQTFQAAKGEYIALCEGDDFWTDSKKLQLQIDFLDSHPEYALCFHPVRVFFENAEEADYTYPEAKTNFTVRELLKENFIQTNSVVYRRQKYTNMPHNILPIDWYLHLYHAQFGKIGFVDRVMSAYRKHPGGVWWESGHNIDAIWKKYALPHMALYVRLVELFDKKTDYKRIIYGHIRRALYTLAEIDKKDGSDLVGQVLKELPGIVKPVLVNQYEVLEEQQKATAKAQEKLIELENSLLEKDHLLQKKSDQIRDMKSSRFWKARNIAARLIGRQII